MHLAVSYKKDKQWQEVVSSCQEMIVRGEGGAWPYIELAKYYEHVLHDIPRALSYAGSALRYSLNMTPIQGANEDQDAQIRRRIERLKTKQKRQIYHEEDTEQ